IAMVVSTTAGTPRGDLAGKQIFFAVLGLIAAGVLLAIDYRILLQYSPGLYGFTLLVLLLLPIFGERFLRKDYQKDRIRTFLDPNLAARGAGYQVRQARIAIGSGGIIGKGWKRGTQSRL